MPMVLIIMSTLMLIILLVSQAIVTNQRQITKYSYQLIARAAAKAAVDIAKEEIDKCRLECYAGKRVVIQSNLLYCGFNFLSHMHIFLNANNALFNRDIQLSQHLGQIAIFY